VGVPIPAIMLTAVQRSEVIAEFQRVMGEYLAAEPASAAIARSPNEEPIVLQKPTTAAVLNNSLGELVGLATLPVVKMAIPPPAVADAAAPRAAAEERGVFRRGAGAGTLFA